MNIDIIKFIQQQLNKQFNLNLTIDGDAGAQTLSGIMLVKDIPTDWTKERKLVGYIQYLCKQEGIDTGTLDGYWGPQTEYGYEQLQSKINTGSLPAPWRTDSGNGLSVVPGNWPPQTQTDLEQYYGKVGTNQTHVVVPYSLKIAWQPKTTVTKFSCHEKVADSIVRVLTRVVDHYGEDKIDELGLNMWGGCLNVRKMRGGTQWSTHSWGIAIDWDPTHNSLHMHRDTARFAKPEYEMWWKLWEDEGWNSLGRVKNYDWMHVQAARIK